MSWYYAGPEAKPVGPISLEELHARKAAGTVSPETYVIEYTGQPNDPRAWQRYKELFPALPVTPPAFLPASPPLPVQPHPLFPSAASHAPHHPAFSSPAGPDPYYTARRSNVWCQWGLGLGIASLVLLPFCGLGALLALPALMASLVGLASRRREQTGRGLALSGLLLSGVVLVITLVFLAWAIPALIKQHEQTTTEQSTNDSD